MSTTLDQIATRIIKEQELIIGPIAWQEAEKVVDLKLFDHENAEIEASNTNPKEVVNQLVGRYERLFGRASREACRDAVASILAELSPADVPSSLAAA
jgi:hypothetical protein